MFLQFWGACFQYNHGIHKTWVTASPGDEAAESSQRRGQKAFQQGEVGEKRRTTCGVLVPVQLGLWLQFPSIFSAPNRRTQIDWLWPGDAVERKLRPGTPKIVTEAVVASKRTTVSIDSGANYGTGGMLALRQLSWAQCHTRPCELSHVEIQKKARKELADALFGRNWYSMFLPKLVKKKGLFQSSPTKSFLTQIVFLFSFGLKFCCKNVLRLVSGTTTMSPQAALSKPIKRWMTVWCWWRSKTKRFCGSKFCWNHKNQDFDPTFLWSWSSHHFLGVGVVHCSWIHLDETKKRQVIQHWKVLNVLLAHAIGARCAAHMSFCPKIGVFISC